jgi:predicted ArsR family transcriptional regulator
MPGQLDSEQSQSEQRQGALASRTRRRVLAVLEESPLPLDAAAIAERFGIHVTTARFHLEQLEDAGLVERVVQRGGQRGRPRVLFRAAPDAHTEDALRQLNSVLVDALAHDSDGGRSRARDAGERWSHAFADQADAGTDDADPLLRIFERLGFEPEERDERPEPAQRVIELRGCPFRDAAAEHPEVVCSAHRGLLDGTIERLGHDAGEATLLPFVEPELCLVQLRGSLASG